MSYYGWKPYVPVAQRRARAAKEMAKMKKKGLTVQPVEVSGRNIAASFWGKGWCDRMESFSDYENRLPRGRTYVRNGSVCHLEIQPGRIEAIVSGSELYNIVITIAPLPKKKWAAVKAGCAGRIGSLIDLLRGKLAAGVMEVVCHRETGLFPLPGEIKLHCDCPDWAGMCKHVAAVLYGVGARLDHAPEQLFCLRGVNHEELVDVSAAVKEATGAAASRRRLAASGLADVFGIEMAETAASGTREKTAAPPAAKTSARAERPASKTPPERPAKRVKGTKSPKAAGQGGRPAAPSFPEPLTGAAIRAWRTSLGETQAAFAARLAVTAACVSQWEKRGEQPLGVRESTLKALRKAWKLTRWAK